MPSPKIHITSGRVSLFFYEEDGISIETIDLTKNATETISVNIPEFGRHHSRHGFSGNCYYDGSENFGVIVNYPKNSEYRDALCVYNRLSGEYFYIPEKDGIDNFFIGDRILLVRVNEKVLKLSYYEPDGSFIERHDIPLSDYIDGPARIFYRPTKLVVLDSTLHILLDSDSADTKHWLSLDITTNTITRILKLGIRSPFEMMDFEFMSDDSSEPILHCFN